MDAGAAIMKSCAATLICVVLCFGCRPTATEVTARSEQTAREYAAALQEHDFVRFQVLFEESRRKVLSERTFRFVADTVTNVAVLSTSERYSSIQYSSAHGYEGWSAVRTGTLYVTINGKIKYDSIFCGHPAFAVDPMISQLESDDVRMRDGGLHMLTKWHIPTFGFESSEQAQQRAAHIEKIKEWWRDNCSTFDLGEPNLPLSSLDFQTLKNQRTQPAAAILRPPHANSAEPRD